MQGYGSWRPTGHIQQEETVLSLTPCLDIQNDIIWVNIQEINRFDA